MRKGIALVVFFGILVPAQAQLLTNIFTSAETTSDHITIAKLNGRFYLAVKAVNSNDLYVMFSNDGHDYIRGVVSRQGSESAPSIATFRHRLFITWRGVGNNQISVAQVPVDKSGHPGEFVEISTSPQSTWSTPTLLATATKLYVTWRGVGNNQVNVAEVNVH